MVTLLVLFGAFGKDVLLAGVNAISVEVVRLEEACPELLFRHAVRHVFSVFLFDWTEEEKQNKTTEHRAGQYIRSVELRI